MVKVIKITALGEVSEVDEDKDEDYKAMRKRHGGVDAWALTLPKPWEAKKFMLSMVTLGIFTDADDCNFTATLLWKHLRTTEAQLIFGTVFLVNEDNDDVIDMTLEDFRIIMKHLPNH